MKIILQTLLHFWEILYTENSDQWANFQNVLNFYYFMLISQASNWIYFLDKLGY